MIDGSKWVGYWEIGNPKMQVHYFKGCKMRYTVVVENSFEKWCKEGTKELHRENGPAYIYYDNGRSVEHYYLNNKKHNKNGPAFIMRDENGEIIEERYFLNDKKLAKKEWEEQVKQLNQTCNNKIVEIDGKKYKLVEV